MSFRWKQGHNWGSYAIHQAYKPYLCLRPEEWAGGEITVQPRDTNPITISGLGFRPDVVLLISYRPKLANGGSDSAFGARGGGHTFGVLGADVQFTGSARIRHAFEPNWSYWNEDCCFRVCHDFGATEILKLTGTLDANGFTLNQVVNLYDQTDPIAWLALGFGGKCRVGVMTTGNTLIDSVPGRPQGAVFLSTKHEAGVTFRDGYWDYMQGFASSDGSRAAIWGGCRPTSWNWTTERWQDDAAIVLCTAAGGSAFFGATYDVGGIVSSWDYDEDSVSITRSGGTATVTHTIHGFSTGDLVYISGCTQDQYNGVYEITVVDANTYEYAVSGAPATPATGYPKATVGSISLQWPVYGNQLYRVGYIVIAVPSEAGVLETNCTLADGEHLQPTAISPDVLLMQATNYNFDWSDGDCLNFDHTPDRFWYGGSGGLGWHFAPFTEGDYYDAYGVHSFGNAVAERGHYSNSGTQYMRQYIMPGQGSNSNPPAYHCHSVNVIPNPVIVGTNARYAQRHKSASRALLNQSDERP